MSRDIEDLSQEVKETVKAFLADCEAAGIDLLVTCTLRSAQDQAILYAQGRTTPGSIVTNAKPGQSAHNYGFAIDVVPLVHGKPCWDDSNPLWKEIGNFGQARGLEWYGAPDAEFRELPHFQLPNWRTLV